MRWRFIAGLTAAATLASWWLGRRGGTLEPGLEQSEKSWTWRGWRIDFASAGQGAPVLLVHAFYPGASRAQWARNFDFLAERYRVYALDLLGFGLSARPPVSYDPALYRELIKSFLEDNIGEPATVVVSGQAAPFVIKLAADNPDLIHRLILDTPTGLTRFADPPSLAQRAVYGFWRLPIVGNLAYFAMVARRSIKHMLARQVLANARAATPTMIDQIYRQSHQPGAKWAPIAMMCGALNDNVSAEYARLKQPILLVWGETTSLIPLTDAEPFRDSNERSVPLKTFAQCRLMPGYEHPEAFNNQITEWLESLEKAA